MTKGFFDKKEVEIDLTLILGKKELLKPKNPPRKYGCNDCLRCSKGQIKVKDEELSTDDKIVYKMVGCNAPDPIEPEGLGQKRILIVVDELTEYAQVSKSPIVGNERKLLEKAVSEVGLDLYRDCWVVSSIRGKKRSGSKGNAGFERKACSQVLMEDIQRLQPKVIISMGFSSLSVLLSHKLSITNSWDVYESYTIPDQEYMSWIIPTFSPRDMVWELSNRQKRYKDWKKEKQAKGHKIPNYYEEALNPNISLIDNTRLHSDDFIVKWKRMIKAMQSAKEHYVKDVPKDNANELVEILLDKAEIFKAIEYFHSVRCYSNDVEASSLKFQREEAEILCISLSDGIRNVAYMTREPDIAQATADLIADPKVMTIAHNCQYEISAYKSKWNVWMENMYIDSQLLAHAWDHRGSASNLKIQTYFWFGNAGYGDKCKPFFGTREADIGTKYENSNQAINKLPEALDRGVLYEKGLLYPIAIPDDLPKKEQKAYITENKRRDKLFKKGWLTTAELLTYNCLDSIYTTKLVRKLTPLMMNKREFDAVKFSTQGAVAMAKMTYNGLQTDQVKLKANLKELEDEINALHIQIINSEEALQWDGGKEGNTEFNYNSSTQLGRLLFEILKYPASKKTASGSYSADKAALENIHSPMCKLILEKKALAKTADTYLKGYIRESDDNGVVKCNFPLGLTLSWRSSSNSCNFQNNIKHSPRLSVLGRSFMTPFKGQILKEWDFSAAENFAASIVSGDMELLRYNSDPNTDLHGDTAVDIFRIDDRHNLPAYVVNGVLTDAPEGMWKRLRQTGKLFVFPAFFGSNYIGITDSIWEAITKFTPEQKDWLGEHFKAHDIGTKDAFREIVKEAEYQFWEVRFKDYSQYKKDIWKTFVDQGYIQTPVGHVLRSVHNRRTASSYSIQGGSFEKLLCGIIIVQKKFEELRLKSKLIGQVHDSLVASVEPSEAEIVDEIVTLALIKGTENHPLFDWITLDFVLDCDTYVEGNWGSKPTDKRMNVNDYTTNYITA